MKHLLSVLTILMLLAVPSAFAALRTDNKAPAFMLRDRGKKEHRLKELLGAGSGAAKKGGVILSFFASWCPPCREELPLLNGLVDELAARGITVVLIAVREDFGKVGPLLKQLKVDKPTVLADPQGNVTEQYQVRFLPTTFFIASDGTIKDVIFGEIGDQDEVRRSAEKMAK